MSMERVTNVNLYNSVPRKGISWKAIIAGLICALSILLIFNLIGLAVGFGAIDPAEENNPFSGLGTGSLIWWIVSNLIALFIGGYVAGRVGVSFFNKSGMVQGLMTWALYTTLSIWIFTSAIGGIISGVGNVISNVLSGSQNNSQNQVTNTTQQQNQGLDISLEQAKQEFYGLLGDTEKPALDPENIENNVDQVVEESRNEVQQMVRQPGSIDAEIEEIFGNAKDEFQNTFQALDQQALVNVLTSRTDMSESEAERTVDNYLSEYNNLLEDSENFLQQIEKEAQQKAGNVAEAVADAAIYLAIALILGMVTAAAGGYTGVKNLRKDYEKNDYLGHREDEDRHHNR